MTMTLGRIREIIFQPDKSNCKQEVVISPYQREICKIKQPTYCQKVDEVDEHVDEEEYLRNLQFTKIEGERVIDGVIVKEPMLDYFKPMKMRKNNIGMEDKFKMVIVGDYWEKGTVSQVVNLFREYEEIFPRTFLEMKGIMRIGRN